MERIYSFGVGAAYRGPVVYTQKSEFNIVESPEWADRVLQVLSRCWPTMSKVNQTTVIGLYSKAHLYPNIRWDEGFQARHISPTRISSTTYPLSLSRLGSQIRGNLEKFLVDLGVRKHVDLQLIFNR
jgi:hypothetical protein